MSAVSTLFHLYRVAARTPAPPCSRDRSADLSETPDVIRFWVFREQRMIFFSGAWAAKGETIDIGGTGSSAGAAVDELAAGLARHIDEHGNLTLPPLSPREQDQTNKWLGHWLWKLKPGANRPRLETHSVSDLLARV